MKKGAGILILFLLSAVIYGQSTNSIADTVMSIDTPMTESDTLPGGFIVLQNIFRDGEILPEMEIKEVTISGDRSNVSKAKVRRYEKLEYDVRRVYPYTLIVRAKLDKVNADLEKITDERERKRYIKAFEEELFREYEDDIRSLTFAQGKLLIKLIDRETQNSSYDLIKKYAGSFTAAFWQGIARIFGTNLKEKYDPDGEDALIERIIYEIENGYI
ncbi:MAG: DUF4294 domain-containing protein [Bacteroidales bacterium]|nr:DUF4294 domain-containing protein [Bacteroidales bacterium]